MQIGSHDLGGQSPDSLTIADYLKVLGNGSSRPASPSGEAIEAGRSVSRQNQLVRSPTNAHPTFSLAAMRYPRDMLTIACLIAPGTTMDTAGNVVRVTQLA
jgi:hypothetical protein